MRPEARDTGDTPGHERQVTGRHLWEIRFLRELGLFLLVALLLWALYFLRGIFMPLFLALILAHVFNPFVTWLETRWRCHRLVGSLLVLFAVLITIYAFFASLGPILAEQFSALAGRLPEYIRAFAAAYNIDLGNLLDQLDKWLQKLQPKEIAGQLFDTTGQALGVLAYVFTTATYVLFFVAVVAVYFVIFSWRFNSGVNKIRDYVPESRKERIFDLAGKMDEAVGEFFRRRLLVSLIFGALLSAGWFFTDVPYWFFLGMLTGLLNIVPYLSVITWPVAILLKYVDTLTNTPGANPDWMALVVWPSAVYWAAQMIENWVLTPWIQGGKSHMSASTVLIVVFIGGAVAGIWGLLFAIPVGACVSILLAEVVLPRVRLWAATN